MRAARGKRLHGLGVSSLYGIDKLTLEVAAEVILAQSM
jgi:hypothetical protein